MSQKSIGVGGAGEDELDDDLAKGTRKIHLKGKSRYTNYKNRYLLCLLSNFFVSPFTGQMLYMEEWKMIVFLGTPQMNDLDAMIRVGLYINDLSMHDFSR